MNTNLRVKVLTEGVHSGDGSGIIPDSFRIARQLLTRIENTETGEVINKFQVEVPADKYSYTSKTANIKGKYFLNDFKMVENLQTTSESAFQLYLNRNWKAQLAVTVKAPDLILGSRRTAFCSKRRKRFKARNHD